MSVKSKGQQSKHISPLKVFSKLFFSFIGIVFIILAFIMYVALEILADNQQMLTLLGLGSLYQQTQNTYNTYSLIFIVVGIPMFLMGVLSSIYDYE